MSRHVSKSSIREDVYDGETIHFVQDLPCIDIIVGNLVVSLQHGRTKLSRESLGHLHRLADTSGFNDDIVNFISFSQSRQFSQQVSTKSAADASVLKPNELLSCLGDFVVLDEGSVDVQPNGTKQLAYILCSPFNVELTGSYR